MGGCDHSSRVAILTTGGTIAMLHDPTCGGAVPLLEMTDFASALPSDLPALVYQEFCNLPSAHLTLDMLWEMRQVVASLLARKDLQGVVITHGTDTLEETAYLLDLTLNIDKPIVLTGAMRTASELGYDGFANLAAAVRVAGSAKARGLGVLVVCNDQIHAARFVTKMHTQALDTFQSPGWGPVGRVHGGQVTLLTAHLVRCVVPADRLEKRVALLRLAVGVESDLLRFLVTQGTRGIVVEALGGGRVPPWWMPDIRAAIEQGASVVIASRCPAGPVHDSYGYAGAYRDLAEAGALFSHGLNGQKARIKLMAVLGATEDPAQIRRYFATC